MCTFPLIPDFRFLLCITFMVFLLLLLLIKLCPHDCILHNASILMQNSMSLTFLLVFQKPEQLGSLSFIVLTFLIFQFQCVLYVHSQYPEYNSWYHMFFVHFLGIFIIPIIYMISYIIPSLSVWFFTLTYQSIWNNIPDFLNACWYISKSIFVVCVWPHGWRCVSVLTDVCSYFLLDY